MSNVPELEEVVGFLEDHIKDGHTDPYEIAQIMSHELRFALGGAIYAYEANEEALSTGQDVIFE